MQENLNGQISKLGGNGECAAVFPDTCHLITLFNLLQFVVDGLQVLLKEIKEEIFKDTCCFELIIVRSFRIICADLLPMRGSFEGRIEILYKTYCANLNEYARHVSDFKAALMAAGYEWRKDKTGAHYFGLRLNSEYAPMVPL